MKSVKRRATAPDLPSKRPCLTKSIPQGEILTDLRNKKWKLGPSIGIGGFGEIYLASDDITKPVPLKSDYVIKVEPFLSGPLFVEIHVYAKIGKKEIINEYILNRKLKSLGMPHFLGCGSHYFNNERYRFLVLPKYGIDLQTVFLNSGKQFSLKTAFTLATYVIDVLEYVHNSGYVHADIKASNLVLNKENRTPVYLLDYGLSCKFYDDIGNHKKLESDQRKAHNGTLMFTSRDAHFGAHSRRGDLEVLGYNLIQWITGSLPWEGDTDAESVADCKNKLMSNLNLFLTECFSTKSTEPPKALVQYFKYVNQLKFKSKPDYQYCRNLFKRAVRDAGFTYNGDLSLNVNWLQAPKKRFRCNSDRENNLNEKLLGLCAIPVNPRKPCAVRNFNPRLTRKSTHSTVQFDWPKILAGHPEKPTGVLPMYDVPQDPSMSISSVYSDSTDSTNSEKLYTRGLDNPTPQMRFILGRKDRTSAINNGCVSNGTKILRSKKIVSVPMTNGHPVKVTSTKEKTKKDIKPKKKSISFDVTEMTNNNYNSKKIKTVPVRKVTRRCNGLKSSSKIKKSILK